MTDNEMIMWAETCVNGSPVPCSACPFDDDTVTVDECMSKIIKELLEINKRQQAEIEKLKKHNKEYGFCNLLGNCLVYSKNLKDYNDMRKGLKREAYKEFAKELKKYKCLFSSGHELVDVIRIDNLLAEMAGEIVTKVEHNSLCETETYKGEC